MIETMHIQQLYKTARLVLNVEEGMTDEEDVEQLGWLLEQVGVCYVDLGKALSGNWDPEDIDKLIWSGA